jgi:hypothetical protein
MGQEVDADLIEEVEVYNIIKDSVQQSVKKNIFSDLAKAIKEDVSAPTVAPIEYPLPPSLDELLSVLNESIKENENELVQEKTEIERTPENYSTSLESGSRKITEGNEEQSATTGDSGQQPSTQTLADLTAKFISESPKKDSFQQPRIQLPQLDVNTLAKKLQNLEGWLSKISMAGPGSGEVKLRFLDDVDRNSIADDQYLRYESNTGKFTFDAGHKNNFHGAFQSNVIQRLPAGNVSYPVSYNITDFSNGVFLQANSQITIQNPGRYNLQYSIQLENSGAQIASVNIWLRQNGQDVKKTNSKYDVLGKHAGANGAIIAAINYVFETTAANDYVELAWWTNHWDDTFMSTIPELIAIPGVQPNIPETPTAIVTVTPVKVDSY